MELYKYCTYNANSLGILVNSEVWYCKPADFNDPFDGDFSVSKYCSFQEYLDMFGLECNDENYETLKSQYCDSDGQLLQEKHDKLSDMVGALKNTGVLCFSTKRDSVLMWSHYADEHRGFNIKFKIHENIPCKPVEYEDVLPKKHLSYFYNTSAFKNEYIDIVFTKHLDWKYEDEYRVCVNGGNRLMELPGKIIEINFGCQMPESSKKTISNIVKGLSGSKEIEMHSAIKADSLNLKFEKYEGST